MRNFLALAIIAMFVSCKDDEPIINEPISDIPSLEILSVSPQTVTEYEDSIVFTLFYQDGNGDLGHANPDSASLFLVDTRILTTESFFVPLLAPENADITIQGELLLTLDRTILIDPLSESETVYFQIYMKDRAGNISNIALSPAITVLPQ